MDGIDHSVMTLPGRQPQQRCLVQQEYRDTSLVLTVFLADEQSPGHYTPLIELFVPQDTAILPELVHYVPVVHGEVSRTMVRSYLSRTPYSCASCAENGHQSSIPRSRVYQASAVTEPAHHISLPANEVSPDLQPLASM